ncbi:MAG: T9SS type A sorting domain-containing protein [Bacteroidales bacterium]|nr:T9SS type A sorting domain-containing protein [Bacteroidales bacterium]
MKKILLPLVCLLFGIFQMSAQNHRVVSNTDNQITFTVFTGELITSDVTIEQGQFTRLMLDGCVPSVDNVGKPELPIMVKTIEIPVCGNLHVTATAGHVRTLTAEEAGIAHTLYPTQQLYHKSYMGDRTFVKDAATYSTDATYGMPLATVAKAGIARDVNMADVRICPVQVNPVTNVVTIYEDITVTVTYDNVDMAATREMKLKYASPAFGRPTELANSIEVAGLRDALTTTPVKYLIIANDIFNGQLDNFVNWKRRKGFLVEVAYTGTIGTTTTAIKNYITGLFTNATATNPAPTYVLLVGDQAQIPTYSTQVSGMTSHVTDLYYFTQVGNDNVPDCYWGRFSAQNVSQLTPQIEKTLMYEQLTMPDPSYLDNCLLVAGEDGGSSGDYGYSMANPAMHYLEDTYSEDFFTDVTSFYNPHASSNAASIRTALSRGMGYANYSAHCSSSGWSIPEFSTTNVGQMTNTGKFGIMIGNCCQSNKFEESECFGEALLRANNKGAVGYIGGTDYTYWYHDYYWAVGAHGSLQANCTNCNIASYDANNLGAYDCLFHTHNEAYNNWYITQGSVIYAGNMAVQAAYSATDNYVKYYWEIYELMGDPSVMTWLGQPEDMNIRVDNIAPVNNTIEVIDGTTSIAVSTGAPYTYIALTHDLDLVTAVLSDANGIATLTFPAVNAGETYELAASAQNYKTTFTTINVMAGEGARVIISNVAVTNDAQAVANAHLTLDVTIENHFPDAGTNTSISAVTTSNQITLTDATETVGTVNSGDVLVLNASFALNVGNALSDGDIAPILFTVSYLSNGTAETTTYTYNLMLVDALLAYVSDSHTIIGGNNDDIINPGETVNITITDQNIGHATAQNVVSELSTYYGLTPVTNSPITIGAVNEQAECTSTFTVNIGSDVPNGTLVPFYHHIYSTTNAALSRVDTIWLVVGTVTATETWETGDMSLFDWTPSATYPWTIVNTGAYAGTYCAKSGNAGVNSSTSELELTIDAPMAGEVSYYSKVSSENNYDFFRFYLDGVQMEQRSGTNGNWQLSSWPIEAGVHTLKFAFDKDYSQASGSDCAWVDNISFPGGGEIAPEPEVLNDISHSVIITTGNGDEEINPSEGIDLIITTENLSTEGQYDVISVLSTNSPYATIANANETISYIAPSSTATTTYHVTIDPNTPDNTLITFNHVASTDVITSTTYTANIVVREVASPALVKVSDSYTVSGGNNDNTIDPGETVVLTIVDENTGRADAPDVISHLSTYYTPAAVTNGTITVGTIEAEDQYASVFTINIGADVPVGTIIPYVHHIFSTTDARADRTDTIYLTVGSTEATEDWESGTFTQFEWVNNSQYPWAIVNDANEAIGGSYYAKSGNAGRKNTESNLELTIDCIDGEISFYSKVAARPNYGFFRFYIDGVQQLEVSNGVQSSGGWGGTYTDTCTWQYHAYPITAGTHTIKFAYVRNNSGQNTAYGSDCAKLDNITWPTSAGGGIAPMPEGIVITNAGLNTNSNGYELETADFDVTLENSSAEAIENVNLTMTTTSSALTLTDNTETVASIGSTETLDLTSIFSGNIAAVADGHVVNCTVTADYLLNDVPTQQTYNFSFTVHSAILQDMTHNETIVAGNNDEEINPGETVEIVVTTGNIGVAAISGVTSELTTVSTYATITNGAQTISSIDANGTATTTYTVDIAPNTPDNTTIVFTHTASDDVHGSTTISFSINVVEVAMAHLVDVTHNETIIAGNDDSAINPGEIVRVNVNTRNDGRAAANNAVSELTTESSYATINNGSQIIGTIAPNASVNSQFDIEISDDAPDQAVIEFVHTMYSDEDTCTMTFSLTVTVYTGTPDLIDESYTVSIISGNGDNDINPDETIKVTVYSRNNGDGNAENIVSTLMTTSAYASIEEPVVNFAGAAPNASLTSQYNVSIDANTPNNTNISFSHTITDGTSSDNLSFDIVVINNSVGISETGLTTVTLYPNPTSANVTVTLGDGVQATHIRLLNTVGQLISTTAVNDTATVLNLSQLPNGIYFVQICNGQELVTTGKVIKR